MTSDDENGIWLGKFESGQFEGLEGSDSGLEEGIMEVFKAEGKGWELN